MKGFTFDQASVKGSGTETEKSRQPLLNGPAFLARFRLYLWKHSNSIDLKKSRLSNDNELRLSE